jgi:hypothetical protein
VQQAFAPSLANVRELSKTGMMSLSAQEKMREETKTGFNFLTGFLVAFCRHAAGFCVARKMFVFLAVGV